MKRNNMLIGITGTDGAGKGAVVDYLVNNHNFKHLSARKIFVEELKKEGKGTTRSDMRLKANEMRAQFGDDFVVSYNLKKIKEEGIENAIIESLRAVAEVETLVKNGGILLAVDADQKLRYERVQARKSESDKISFEEFVQHEELEANDPDPHGMQKQAVIDMADYTLYNNGTIEELHGHVEEVLTEIKAN